ncbi:Cyclin N-terminal domain-containing protein [Fusarium sp. Ph1]|nr:Cyclin N-terminal domain-containing protein [Fusarium sp. Ph1]
MDHGQNQQFNTQSHQCRDEVLAKSRNHDLQAVISYQLSLQTESLYREEILQHLEHMQDITLPDAAMVAAQKEITWSMRSCLIDFLVEAHGYLGLTPQALFLSINLVDRYCSRREVRRGHYWLLGSASLLIASKYGDKRSGDTRRNHPSIREISGLCCGVFNAATIAQMEMSVLNTLDWIVGHPTVDCFVEMLLLGVERDEEFRNMVAYICEIALYHRDFVSVKPSIVAEASLLLAQVVLQQDATPRVGTSDLVRGTVKTLSAHLRYPRPVLADKFSTSKRSRVAQRLLNFCHQHTR